MYMRNAHLSLSRVVGRSRSNGSPLGALMDFFKHIQPVAANCEKAPGDKPIKHVWPRFSLALTNARPPHKQHRN